MRALIPARGLTFLMRLKRIARKSEVRAHQMARKLRSAGFAPQKLRAELLIKWLFYEVAGCRVDPALPRWAPIKSLDGASWSGAENFRFPGTAIWYGFPGVPFLLHHEDDGM